MSTNKKKISDDEDLYSDLPQFEFEDSMKKLQNTNKELLSEKEKLQQKITEMEEKVKQILKDKSEIEKKNNNLSFNISSLYKTAKHEIQRKDKLIQELRKNRDDMIFRRRGIRRNFSDESKRSSRDFKQRPTLHNRRTVKYSDSSDDENETKCTSKIRLKDTEEEILRINEKKNNLNEEKIRSTETRVEDVKEHISEVDKDQNVVYFNEVKQEMSEAISKPEIENSQLSPTTCEAKAIVLNKPLPPKLNVPLTAYTKRMYKRHYGVSPEKVLPKDKTTENSEALNETVTICSKSVVKNNSPEPKENSVGKPVIIKTEKPTQLSQNFEENAPSVSAKNIRRISRVRTNSEAKNPPSEFIKLGDRNISMKVIEQRIATKYNNTPTRPTSATAAPQQSTVMKKDIVTLKISTSDEQVNNDCKISPDETLKSVLERGQSLSPRNKLDESKSVTPHIKSSKSFGLFKKKLKKPNVTIIPAKIYDSSENPKTTNNISVKPVNIRKEIEKPSSNVERRSRQEKFLESLFSPEKIQKRKTINNINEEKSKINSKNKEPELESSKPKLKEEIFKSDSKIESQKEESHENSSKTNIDVDEHNFQIPLSKSDKNPPEIETNVISSKEDCLPLAINGSVLKFSPPENSMSGYSKFNENSCISINEDTIGMITRLAKQRTTISPITTPKKPMISIDSVDENASSPKMMTRSQYRENNTVQDKNHDSQIKVNNAITPTKASSEHQESRRSKRVLGIVKNSLSPLVKAVTQPIKDTFGVKRKINLGDSSEINEIKRQKIVNEDESRKTFVISEHNKRKRIDKKIEDAVSHHHRESNKKCDKKKRDNKDESNEHRKSSERNKSPGIKSRHRRLSRKYKKPEDNERHHKKYAQGKYSQKHRRTTRDKQSRSPVDKERHKIHSPTHRSPTFSKHKIFSGSKSGFQRHSPSEFFNRKQRSRRFLTRRFDSPARFRSSTPRQRHSLRKQERTQEKNELKEHRSEDLRKEITTKESLKTTINTEVTPVQTPPQQPNWKLTLISIDKKNVHPSPSPSIEKGRIDPRTTIKTSTSEDIKSNRILTDQTNQVVLSNDKISLESPNISPDKKPIKAPLIAKRRNRSSVKFEDNSLNPKINQDKSLTETSVPIVSESKSSNCTKNESSENQQTSSPGEQLINASEAQQTEVNSKTNPPSNTNSQTTNTKIKSESSFISKRNHKRNINFGDNHIFTSSINVTPDDLNELNKIDTPHSKTNSDTNSQTSNTPPKTKLKSSFVLKRRQKHKINLEDNLDHSLSTSDNLVPDDSSLNTSGVQSLTSDNIQKLNESSPLNFSKTIVKTPLNFRQSYDCLKNTEEYSSVYSSVEESVESDQFGNMTESASSDGSDYSWKP